MFHVEHLSRRGFEPSKSERLVGTTRQRLALSSELLAKAKWGGLSVRRPLLPSGMFHVEHISGLWPSLAGLLRKHRPPRN
jgi:hypothetical protein